jgi:hypothetical protein
MSYDPEKIAKDLAADPEYQALLADVESKMEAARQRNGKRGVPLKQKLTEADRAPIRHLYTEDGFPK